MQNTAEQIYLSPEDYLTDEKDADFRHEYLLGLAYAMAGASDAHVRISGNVFAFIKAHLRGSECSVYVADMKVRIKEGDAFFYPDVLVSCELADRKRNYFKESPKLIAEVISKTTEGYDRGDKFAYYRQLASLLEYVLIDSRSNRVDVFQRNAAGRWEMTSYSESDEIVEFSSIGLKTSLRDIYEDVDFGLEEKTDDQ
jgi:Uma2 family endonuclease